MLPKEDRKAMLLRLYNDDSPLMDHSKDRFNVKPNQEQIGFGTEAEQQVAESVDEQNGILITTEENDAGEDIAAS
jgi:multisite-specific tRNA:(cytosine-C5)-methyltransferase